MSALFQRRLVRWRIAPSRAAALFSGGVEHRPRLIDERSVEKINYKFKVPLPAQIWNEVDQSGGCEG